MAEGFFINVKISLKANNLNEVVTFEVLQRLNATMRQFLWRFSLFAEIVAGFPAVGCMSTRRRNTICGQFRTNVVRMFSQFN